MADRVIKVVPVAAFGVTRDTSGFANGD